MLGTVPHIEHWALEGKENMVKKVENDVKLHNIFSFFPHIVFQMVLLWFVNSLLNNKILDPTKMKGLADEKINVTKM